MPSAVDDPPLLSLRVLSPAQAQRKAYWCLCFIGLGLLVTWNAVLAADDYFTLLYPDRTPMFYFSIACEPSVRTWVCFALLPSRTLQWRRRATAERGGERSGAGVMLILCIVSR